MSIRQTFYAFLPFLILLTFASFMNTMARVILPPLTPLICEELHLCHGEIGNLFFILSVGFAFSLFGSQFLSSKISHKKTIVFSLVSTGCALMLSSFADSFHHFRLSLFALGLTSGFFVPSSVAMLRQGMAREHLGKAFGIFATAQSIAFIISPLLVQFAGMNQTKN